MNEIIVGVMQPLTEIIQGISYPVCFFYMSWGFVDIMMGNKKNGMDKIKWSAVGYIGFQLVPKIMMGLQGIQ